MRTLISAHQFGSSYEVDEDYDQTMNGEESEQKVQQLTTVYRELLATIDEDVDRQGLKKTPERAAKALWYFTKGYRQNLSGEYSNGKRVVRHWHSHTIGTLLIPEFDVQPNYHLRVRRSVTHTSLFACPQIIFYDERVS